MLDVMGTCHSLTRVEGKLIGDPLELKMLEWTGLELEENTADKYDDMILGVVGPKGGIGGRSRGESRGGGSRSSG